MNHQFARRLRRDQTDVERKLWSALRSRHLYGFKFRRQQPIGPYVVDFVCLKEKFVIELDGSQHGADRNLAADAMRTAYLQAEDFRVKRYWNLELIENFPGVVDDIGRELGR